MGRSLADCSCCSQHKPSKQNICPGTGTTIKPLFQKHSHFVSSSRKHRRLCSPLVFLSPLTFPLPLGKSSWIKTRNSIIKSQRSRTDHADHFSADAPDGHQEYISMFWNQLKGIWGKRQWELKYFLKAAATPGNIRNLWAKAQRKKFHEGCSLEETHTCLSPANKCWSLRQQERRGKGKRVSKAPG